MPESRERQDARAVYNAELQTVGSHLNGTFVNATSVTLTKPSGATHLYLQALTNALRYRIDGVNPTIAFGFQLAAGTLQLIPCPNDDIRVISPAGAGTYEYQWVR